MKIGRISRRTYIITSLPIILINLFMYVSLGNVSEFTPESLIYPTFIMIIALILIVGRLHDINLSGWYSLLLFIPIINFGGLALYFIDGTVGPNRYGEDPKIRTKEKHIQPISLNEIDRRIELLNESFNAGILDKFEFEEKMNNLIEEKNNLIKEKEKLIKETENKNAHTKDIFKVKMLFENGLITQAEYDEKIKSFNKKHGINYNSEYQISSNTQVYYIAKGQECGPVDAIEIKNLLNRDEININSWVRTQYQSEYSYRAHEIVEIFK